MVLILLFIFFFFYFLYKNKKKKAGLVPSSLIFLLYALTFLSSVILLVFFKSKTTNIDRETLVPGILYLFITLFVFLFPFIFIKENLFSTLLIPNQKLFSLFSLITTILSLYSLFYFLPSVLKVILLDASSIAINRQLIAQGNNPFISQTIFNTIAGVSASFYLLQLIIFFIRLNIDKKLTFYSFIILLSSFSYPFFVLAYIGRDGILFWFLSFLSLYFLLGRNINLKLRKIIKKAFIIILFLGGGVFFYITYSRFNIEGEDSINNILFPYFNYLGQQSLNFSEYFNLPIQPQGVEGFLPLFASESDKMIIDHNAIVLENNDVVPWVFKTFVGSFYTGLGSLGTILLGIILSLVFIFYSFKQTRGVWSFSYLLIYVLLSTIYTQGVFYFRQYNRVGNLVIVVFVLLALFFHYSKKQTLIITHKRKTKL